MKNSYLWRVVLLSGLFWWSLASAAEAVGVRLRLLLPTGGSAEVGGFANERPETGEFGLSLLLPATESLRVVAGYSYFIATVKQTQDNATISRLQEGNFSTHLLEAGLEYDGIEIFSDYRLLLSLTARLPLGAEGKVDTADAQRSAPYDVTRTSTSSSEVQGGGVLASLGVSRGRWDVALYYQGTRLDYGMDVPQQSGAAENAEVQLTEYGLSLGYRF